MVSADSPLDHSLPLFLLKFSHMQNGNSDSSYLIGFLNIRFLLKDPSQRAQGEPCLVLATVKTLTSCSLFRR